MAEVLSQNQIDALLSAALSGTMDLQGEDENQAEKYRKYNFHSPRKFTKDRLRILSGIFDNYTRVLTGRINAFLHTSCEVALLSIEEQRYYDFSNALIEGDVVTVVRTKYPDDKIEETPILLHASKSVLLSMIDRLLGCIGDPDNDLSMEYTLTDVELKLGETLFRHFISLLGSSWESYMPLQFSFHRIEPNPTLVQLISMDDTVVIVEIELKFPNCQGRLNLCLPGTLLANFFAHITKHNVLTRGQADDQSEHIFSSIRQSDLELVAQLCTTQIQLSDLYSLSVGDIIQLNRPKTAPVYINIGNRRWFEGTMGVYKEHLAIKIQQSYKSQEGDVNTDGN